MNTINAEEILIHSMKCRCIVRFSRRIKDGQTDDKSRPLTDMTQPKPVRPYSDHTIACYYRCSCSSSSLFKRYNQNQNVHLFDPHNYTLSQY